MTQALTLYAALTIVLTATLIVYALSVLSVFRDARGQVSSHPAWSLVPVITPFAAWRIGSRGLAIALGALMTLYLVLQILAQTHA